MIFFLNCLCEMTKLLQQYPIHVQSHGFTLIGLLWFLIKKTLISAFRSHILNSGFLPESRFAMYSTSKSRLIMLHIIRSDLFHWFTLKITIENFMFKSISFRTLKLDGKNIKIFFRSCSFLNSKFVFWGSILLKNTWRKNTQSNLDKQHFIGKKTILSRTIYYRFRFDKTWLAYNAPKFKFHTNFGFFGYQLRFENFFSTQKKKYFILLNAAFALLMVITFVWQIVTCLGGKFPCCCSRDAKTKSAVLFQKKDLAFVANRNVALILPLTAHLDALWNVDVRLWITSNRNNNQSHILMHYLHYQKYILFAF